LSDRDKVTLTLKADGSAPWIVVHAESAEETHKILDAVVGGAQSIAAHAALAASVLSNLWQDQKGQQPVQNNRAANDYPTGGATGPDGPMTCAHGERVYRSGTSAKGPWEAMFCPTEKGTPGQCAPLFKDRKTGLFT
jgi:hypothetical protein